MSARSKRARSIAADVLILDLEDSVAAGPQEQGARRRRRAGRRTDHRAARDRRAHQRPRHAVDRARYRRHGRGAAGRHPGAEAVAHRRHPPGAGRACRRPRARDDQPVGDDRDAGGGAQRQRHGRDRRHAGAGGHLLRGRHQRSLPPNSAPASGRGAPRSCPISPRWSLAARAHGLAVLDGTFNDLDDKPGLAEECVQGRDLGMDGKTLIHPEPGDGRQCRLRARRRRTSPGRAR